MLRAGVHLWQLALHTFLGKGSDCWPAAQHDSHEDTSIQLQGKGFAGQLDAHMTEAGRQLPRSSIRAKVSQHTCCLQTRGCSLSRQRACPCPCPAAQQTHGGAPRMLGPGSQACSALSAACSQKASAAHACASCGPGHAGALLSVSMQAASVESASVTSLHKLSRPCHMHHFKCTHTL